MLLEPLFNDPALRKTNFVMLHGGWPFTRLETALLTKPNAYLDFSAQTFMNYPHDTAAAIRAWLDYVPEKVMFATDAYPFAPPDNGWEEAGWIANSTGREAWAWRLLPCCATTKSRATAPLCWLTWSSAITRASCMV